MRELARMAMVVETAKVPPDWIGFDRYETSIPVGENASHRSEVLDEEDITTFVSGPVEDEIAVPDDHVATSLARDRSKSPGF